jgi:hypothetical protein
MYIEFAKGMPLDRRSRDTLNLPKDTCRDFLSSQRARLRNTLTGKQITPEYRELTNRRITNLLHAEQAYKKAQAKILKL